MTLLQVQNLDVAIHGKSILQGVQFTIEPGQIVALTGESGSGKSMTALATMGLLPHGSKAGGTVVLDGQDILTTDEATLCTLRGNAMGMVFQEPMTALNPVQPIGAQVAETIRIHTALPKSAAMSQAREMLNRVGLSEFPMGRYPHELSGGQRQRVVIAMAIAQRPKLLIADEPTTALDVTTQAQILDLLKGLVRDFDMGLMMITHDLAVVADMADRIVVMQNGGVVETGATQDILHRPTHNYTRSLLAASTHRPNMPPRIAPQNDPILVVRDATRTYPEGRRRLFAPQQFRTAVDSVTLTIHAKERVGLVGESGCGKSTLTRAILGLEPLQGGTILAFGQDITHLPPALRSGLQVVFQDPYSSFNPRHTVARLITEPYHLLPQPPQGANRREAVAQALSAVGLLPSDMDKYIHEFSGGQRQRIAIARALILRPDLIIFDEAVSALDVSVRAQVLDLLATLCKNYGLAYLFISHDLSVVRAVTDRVLVMQAGKIVEQGDTETVFERPSHPYTRALIAAAPVLPDLKEKPA